MILELTWTSAAGAIAALFAIYKGITFLLDRYDIGRKRKDAHLMMDATRNMMREIVRNTHHDFMAEGYIPDDELEHLEKVYQTYHDLGGNGTATRWYEELKKLPRSKEV